MQPKVTFGGKRVIFCMNYLDSIVGDLESYLDDHQSGLDDHNLSVSDILYFHPF